MMAAASCVFIDLGLMAGSDETLELGDRDLVER
jgi:hypothetical protein